ncbi:MAG TPA: hypothetical protein DEP69_05255, partial [Acidimicrobiaceae bacterium]|nr:hypothetical protein [Acidimicrobiaceae bacterium]
AGAVAAALALALLAGACSPAAEPADTVRVLTHDDFHLPADALAEFEETTGLKVVVFRQADRAAVVDLLRRSADNPVADVVIGIDTLDVARVVADGLVEPHQPLRPEAIDPQLRLEGDWMVPVSYLDACLVFAPSWYEQPDRRLDELPDADDPPPLPEPAGLDDLVDPRHAPTAVLPDAGTARMGLYLLAALERLHPENVPDTQAWPQFLSLMLRSGVEIVPSWEDAYFGRFLPGTVTAQAGAGPAGNEDAAAAEAAPSPTGAAPRPLTWASAGMPAVNARYQPQLALLPEESRRLDIAVVADDCVRVVNYAGVVAGTPARSAAGRLVDFTTSPVFQYGVPDRFGSRPARADILSTDEWRAFGVEVTPAVLDPGHVGANWEVWRLTWQQVVRETLAGGEPVPPVVTVTLP